MPFVCVCGKAPSIVASKESKRSKGQGAREMKRNRIVINLDQAQGGEGSSGKRARLGLGLPLLIVAVVLLLLIGGVVGGGYLWWRHYQGSPAYSLALLAGASQRNDTATGD